MDDAPEWTCHPWRRQYGGTNRDDLKRVKEAETGKPRLRSW